MSNQTTWTWKSRWGRYKYGGGAGGRMKYCSTSGARYKYGGRNPPNPRTSYTLSSQYSTSWT